MPSLLLDLATTEHPNGQNYIISISAANRIEYSVPVITGFDDRSQYLLSTQFQIQIQAKHMDTTNTTLCGFDSDLCFTELAWLVLL